MAELLKATHPITTLRLQLEPKVDELFVVAAIDRDQTTTDLVHASTQDFGIPDDLDASGSVEFRLPTGLLDSIQQQLDARNDAASPLWIQFAGTVGALTALPWERLLRPLSVPVLRLPYSVIQPLVGDASMRVAVVGSMPRAKTPFDLPELVSRAIDVAQTTRPGTIVDVFVDGGWFEDVRAQERRWPEPAGVTMHDPRGVTFPEPSATWSIASTATPTNPWLQWVASALGTVPVDLVHFVCPGYHCVGQGSLALAQTPAHNEDDRLARFVGGTELQAFLRSTGAWYVHLTDATADVWGIGLRLLADELAQSRAGIVALDAPHATDPETARSVRRFVLGEAPPVASATALYCHPGMVEGQDSLVDFDIGAAMRTLTLVGSDAETLVGQHDEVAGWITSTQRFLEDQVGQLLANAQPSAGDSTAEPSWSSPTYTPPDDYPQLPMSSLTTSPGDDAAARGVADALKFIADIVGESSRDPR